MTKRFTVDENHQGVYAYIKDNNEYIGKRCGKKNIYYVCDLLNEQDQRIKELEEQLKLVCKADSLMAHDSVKEIIRDAIRGLDTVAENSSTAFDHYVVLDKVFKEQYNNELWDNYD